MLDQPLVEDCTNEYHRSFDRLLKLVLCIVDKLESELKERKIMARVSGRVKGRESLRAKLMKWANDEEKAKLFLDPRDVYKYVGDLAAVRVMTYVEQDRERVANIAKELFTHRPGRDDFEYEIKEDSPRVKSDDANYYRATHMQIRLKKADLTGNTANLADDHCELQITSMLAHVWNEIEHDIVYKGDKTNLSTDEVSSLESLGLLTKTGDNIIVNLMNANSRRVMEQHKKSVDASKEILSSEALSSFLEGYYGTKLFSHSQHIDYRKNNEPLFLALRFLGITHPIDITTTFTPSSLYEMKKSEWPLFKKFLDKNGYERPTPDINSSDLFLLSLMPLNSAALAAFPHTGMGPKPRQIALAQRWESFLSSR
ncbi:RelA/SpoT domain-containing protein [Agrobacterium pusense]|uniref:RelA/SpoT domain-containing protein n=1 Tax=Agrobacterium pusense TaxID=648995 RepID=UPI002F42FC83